MFPSPFQSTHPLRGATSGQLIKIAALHISIHAPLVGCDPGDAGDLYALWGISIHAPLAGCDVAPFHARVGHTHFNPRTPRGVRHAGLLGRRLAQCISIHAPLAGCDHPARCSSRQGHHFNPRTPRGVRRGVRLRHRTGSRISIHAPLAGCPFFPGGIPTHRRRRTHPVSGKKCAYPG